MEIDADYRPHHSSRRIAEIAGPTRDALGGTFWVFLHNTSRSPIVVSAIRINGQPAESLTNGRGLNWFRLTPEPIPPRGTSLLILNAQQTLLHQAPLTLEIYKREGEVFRTMLPMESAPLTLSAAWIDGRTLTVWVRNEDPHAHWEIERLLVGGDAIRFTTPQRRIAPGEITYLKAQLRSELPAPMMLPIQVYGQSGKRTTHTGGGIRPIARFFPIGTGATTLWEDPKRLHEWAERGFNTFVYSAENALTDREGRAFKDLCPQLGIKALVFAGFPRPATQFIERNATNPHIVAYMIEPDWDDPNQFGMHLPTLCERVAQVFRDRQITQPLSLNLARSRRFGEFATIPDIACYEAYRVGAPMPNLSPDPWGNLLELAGTYTEDLRANCEPLPFWAWAQGAHPWEERVWVDGQLGRACPTPEEIRVQLWLQLARGAKGVLWFTGFREELFQKQYTQSKALPDSVREEAIPILLQQGREAFEEQTRLNRFLEPIKPALLATEWQPNAVRIIEATRPERLDGNLLVGESIALVWLTNLDYTRHPQGYQFRLQQNLRCEVRLPRWLRPMSARFVAPLAGAAPVDFTLTGRTLTFGVESLPDHVGLLVLQT